MVFELPDFDVGGFDFQGDFSGTAGGNEPPDRMAAMADEARTVAVFRTISTHQKMRLLSEKALDDVLPWHFEHGYSYHVVSYGDVDSLTYLRHVAKSQRLKYVILATWCMAQIDADEIDNWVERGIIGRIDYVVGEVFKSHSRYREICKTLRKTVNRCGGRVLR